MKLTFVLLLLSIISFAQQEYKEYYDEDSLHLAVHSYYNKSGIKWKEYTFEGLLKQEGQYDKQGNKHGEWKDYTWDGKLEKVEHYKNGKFHGVQKLFYSNSKQLRYFIEYKNGEYHGKFITYHENGVVDTEGIYNNGKRTGEWNSYHKNGVLAYTQPYKNGNETGITKVIRKDSTLLATKNYNLNDSLFWKKEFNYMGELTAEGFVNKNTLSQTGEWKEYWGENRDNVCTGIQDGYEKMGQWVCTDIKTNHIYLKEEYFPETDDGKKACLQSFYDNGNLREKGCYYVYRDSKIGLWEVYYENGQLEKKGNYTNDHKTGKWFEYYENGQLRFNGTYDENEFLIGERVRYFQNGQIKSSFKFNTTTKLWEYFQYFENGNLELEKYYKEDEKGNTKKFGQWKTYLKNGKLKHSETIVGKDYSNEVYYYENGNKRIELTFLEKPKIEKAERIAGESIKVNLNETQKKSHSAKTYYENGNLESEGNILNSFRNKVDNWKFYHENGTIKEEGKFYYGSKIGEWKYYDSNGNLKETKTYEIESNEDQPIKKGPEKVKTLPPPPSIEESKS